MIQKESETLPVFRNRYEIYYQVKVYLPSLIPSLSRFEPMEGCAHQRLRPGLERREDYHVAAERS